MTKPKTTQLPTSSGSTRGASDALDLIRIIADLIKLLEQSSNGVQQFDFSEKFSTLEAGADPFQILAATAMVVGTRIETSEPSLTAEHLANSALSSLSSPACAAAVDFATSRRIVDGQVPSHSFLILFSLLTSKNIFYVHVATKFIESNSNAQYPNFVTLGLAQAFKDNRLPIANGVSDLYRYGDYSVLRRILNLAPKLCARSGEPELARSLIGMLNDRNACRVAAACLEVMDCNQLYNLAIDRILTIMIHKNERPLPAGSRILLDEYYDLSGSYAIGHILKNGKSSSADKAKNATKLSDILNRLLSREELLAENTDRLAKHINDTRMWLCHDAIQANPDPCFADRLKESVRKFGFYGGATALAEICKHYFDLEVWALLDTHPSQEVRRLAVETSHLAVKENESLAADWLCVLEGSSRWETLQNNHEYDLCEFKYIVHCLKHGVFIFDYEWLASTLRTTSDYNAFQLLAYAKFFPVKGITLEWLRSVEDRRSKSREDYDERDERETSVYIGIQDVARAYYQYLQRNENSAHLVHALLELHSVADWTDYFGLIEEYRFNLRIRTFEELVSAINKADDSTMMGPLRFDFEKIVEGGLSESAMAALLFSLEIKSRSKPGQPNSSDNASAKFLEWVQCKD